MQRDTYLETFYKGLVKLSNCFPEIMLTSFQCCSLKMFPSNGERTTMADGEVEVE